MNYQVKQVGAHRGKPRLYFQSQTLAAMGFSRGTRYSLEKTDDSVTLRICADGTHLVSGKGEGAKAVPVIDINSAAVLEAFQGMEAVKVIFSKGALTISKLASEEAAQSRLTRLKTNVSTSLAVAGLAFGAGIMDASAHQGMLQAGVQSHTVVVNEIDADLLEHASRANPVITPNTIQIAAPMQEAIQDEVLMGNLPKVDVLLAGIPCSGASRAGKSKNGIDMMEAHAEVGHLVHAFLVFMQKLQPGIVVIENVPEYASSASAHILRSQMRDMGYSTEEVNLDSQDFGAIEKRQRWFMVAATRGVKLDLSGLAPTARPVRTVAEILDTHNNHHWGTFDYLKSKAVTDKAAGKGFQMQLVQPTDTKVPTLRKAYYKGGSTDPLLVHPTDPNLLRLFSGDEHARLKGVAPELVEGLSNTDKHIALGQGVAPGMVRALLQRAMECVKRATGTADQKLAYRLDRAVG